MKEIKNVEQRFYEECGNIIGIPHNYKLAYLWKTRWNNRDPGNGRFPGWGLVRRYSSKQIHVCHAGVNRFFNSEESVLTYLKDLK